MDRQLKKIHKIGSELAINNFRNVPVIKKYRYDHTGYSILYTGMDLHKFRLRFRYMTEGTS